MSSTTVNSTSPFYFTYAINDVSSPTTANSFAASTTSDSGNNVTSKNTVPLVAIFVPIVVVVLVILLILIVFFVRRRRIRSRKQPRPLPPPEDLDRTIIRRGTVEPDNIYINGVDNRQELNRTQGYDNYQMTTGNETEPTVNLRHNNGDQLVSIHLNRVNSYVPPPQSNDAAAAFSNTLSDSITSAAAAEAVKKNHDYVNVNKALAEARQQSSSPTDNVYANASEFNK